MMRKVFLMVLVVVFVGVGFCALGFAGQCGDGRKEGAEECDNGQNNSDSKANACRTDCTLPRCRDLVRDSNEECDDGSNNSDKIPDACRWACRKAYCGDGVLDEDEECDDKNSDAYDGCHECQECYLPKDNLVLSNIYRVARLCPGDYEFQDQGQEGIVIINSSDATLDCQGATIVGINPLMTQALAGVGAAQMKNIAQQGRKFSTRRDRKLLGKTPPTSTSGAPSGGSPASSAPKKVYAHKGAGIVINGTNVVLQNCNVKGFKYGVKVQSTGSVLLDNQMCDNLADVQGAQGINYGVKNACSKVLNWQENGQPGCTRQCP